MPSHTYNEVGRWSESVRANLEAWHTDQKAKYDEGVAIYPSHNLQMLYYSAAYDGQGAIAIQAAKDFTKLTGNNMHQVLALIRFGRFDEILELTDRPEGDIPGGMWDFAQGYAHLRQGEADFASLYLKRVQTTADTSEAKYRGHPAAHILGVLSGILDSEIQRDAGNLTGAIATLETTVDLEDSMQYDEPEPMPFDSRHWLGAALLEAERYAEAEAVYRTELKDHPRNGWSYFGLVKALKMQGKDTTEMQRKMEMSWARADHWIRSSRF
jgi:tetratricopeptide (TPR) repeat protein